MTTHKPRDSASGAVRASVASQPHRVFTFQSYADVELPIYKKSHLFLLFRILIVLFSTLLLLLCFNLCISRACRGVMYLLSPVTLMLAVVSVIYAYEVRVFSTLSRTLLLAYGLGLLMVVYMLVDRLVLVSIEPQMPVMVMEPR